MRVITCASYYGTGSSAVTDYVTEFSTVKSLGDSEIRILHDMDGVSDLQYHLTENHNRHNSGPCHQALQEAGGFLLRQPADPSL